MKRYALFLMITVFASVALAQSETPTQTPPVPAPKPPEITGNTVVEVLSWMIGEWEGEGIARGERSFIGRLSVTSELDGMGVLLHRVSMNRPGDVAGGLKELMIIGYDGTTKKMVGTLYDNKNTIALYVGEVKENEIDFSQAMAQPGYLSKRSFKLQPDGALAFVIEGATPGKEVSKVVEINFKKK